MEKNNDLALLFIRLILALFIMHGYLKLTGIEGTTKYFASINIPAPMIMAILVGFLEFVGGISVLLGIGTRIFSFLLALTMLVAILTTSLNNILGADLELSLLFASLALSFSGAGKYSIAYLKTKGDENHLLNKI